MKEIHNAMHELATLAIRHLLDERDELKSENARMKQLLIERQASRTKAGCKNFQMRGGEFCGNCGYHLEDHER